MDVNKNRRICRLDYKNIDLIQSATKGYADISTYMQDLGNLSNNMRAQQKLKLLNHQVILDGLKQLNGLNGALDRKVNLLLKNVENSLEDKKTPFVKIFSVHILAFLSLFLITIVVNPDSFNIGYVIASIGMGCATGVLNLMLLRERKKYAINNLFFLLEDEEIEELEPLHKKLAKQIDDFKKAENSDTEELTSKLKKTIQNTII
jgi:hypothetical protein